MGLKKTGSAGTWLSLAEGKFRLKTGDNSYEEYAIVEGRVADIRFVDKEYQGSKYRAVVVTLTDGMDRYSFSVSMSSGYARQLLYKLATADLTQPVELQPTYSEIDGKKVSGMFVTQGGRPCRQKWTKENPGDMPPMKAVEVKGRKIYDDSEQLAFIEKYVATEMLPVIQSATESGDVEAPVAAEVQDDDVPF